jgi:hypothetical protein
MNNDESRLLQLKIELPKQIDLAEYWTQKINQGGGYFFGKSRSDLSDLWNTVNEINKEIAQLEKVRFHG